MLEYSRTLKARALEQSGEARARLALQAAEAYAIQYAKTKDTYNGINMASMYLVGGDIERAKIAAKQILAEIQHPPSTPGLDAYYHIATLAEAQLILGEKSKAIDSFKDAINLAPHAYSAHASTLKQFTLILEAQDEPTDWLDPFRPPKILHFAGHMFGAGDGRTALDDTAIYALEKKINDYLDTDKYLSAYGALAAGSDILIAEQLIKRNIDLHVVLPCPDDLFETISLKPYGDNWKARFDACMKAAKSVRYVSHDNTVADELTAAFASETAKGLTLIEADQLATNAVQILIWDEKPSDYVGGTAYDARTWHEAGREQLIVPYPFKRDRALSGAPWHASNRALKAILFADVVGFGRLNEQQVPVFVEQVFGELAKTTQTLNTPPEHINTWGDGLYMVFDSVQAAAEAALSIQTKMAELDFASLKLPDTMAMRIGGHYGPIHMLDDPFLSKGGIFGREVTVAARIEPKTAPGSIYVSEPFACALAAQSACPYRIERLKDKVPTKDQGDLTLYSLHKIPVID